MKKCIFICFGMMFILFYTVYAQFSEFAGNEVKEYKQNSFEADVNSERPNILILFADDLGYGEIGPHSNSEIPTPNIDMIAENGVTFTDGYVTAPNCSPSRAGLLTGRFGTRFGYEFNPTGEAGEDPRVGIPESELTLAEMVREAGYTTGVVGKWHLGSSAAASPLRHGFDEFFGFLQEGHYYVPPPYDGVTTWKRRSTLPDGSQGRWLNEDSTLVYSTILGYNEPPYDADNPILRDGQPIQEQEYLTDAWTRESVDFIDRHKDKPFLLYVSYNAVHSPLQATEEYMDRFVHIDDIQRRIFAGMLSNLDGSVGSIMKKVRKEGLEENTVVFFISDNGGPTVELTSNNEPLRGGKSDMYEGGVRIPYLMQWKGHIPAGRVEHRPVSSVDVFGTSAALVGAKLPNDRTIDGINLIPYVTGEERGYTHDVLYWRQGNRTAIRVEDWKLVQNERGQLSATWELYNLAEDNSESLNLAAENPDKLQELREVWSKINDEMQESRW